MAEVDPRRLSFKRYGTGKCWVDAYGDPRFHDKVKWAVDRSCRTEVTLDLVNFVKELRALGVPDDAAREFLRTVKLDDEIFLIPHICP